MNTLVNHHRGAAILCSFSHRGFFVSHGAIGVPKKRAYIFLSHTSTPSHTHPNFKSRINYILWHDVAWCVLFSFTIPPTPQKTSFSSNSKWLYWFRTCSTFSNKVRHLIYVPPCTTQHRKIARSIDLVFSMIFLNLFLFSLPVILSENGVNSHNDHLWSVLAGWNNGHGIWNFNDRCSCSGTFWWRGYAAAGGSGNCSWSE